MYLGAVYLSDLLKTEKQVMRGLAITFSTPVILCTVRRWAILYSIRKPAEHPLPQMTSSTIEAVQHQRRLTRKEVEDAKKKEEAEEKQRILDEERRVKEDKVFEHYFSLINPLSNPQAEPRLIHYSLEDY